MKNRNFMRVAFGCLLTLGVFQLAIYVFPTNREQPPRLEWLERMRPSTDKFIALLAKNETGGLIEEFYERSKKGQDNISREIKAFNSEWGPIVAYRLAGIPEMVSTRDDYLYIYYQLENDHQEKVRGVFDIPVKDPKEGPGVGAIGRFVVEGKYGKRLLEIF